MDKREFLKAISHNLKGFDKSEINGILAYYEEIIAYKMESGLTEEEAVASLGDINDITNEIKVNLVSKRDDKKISNSLKSFIIILGICSSPILLPLGVAFAVLFLCLFIVSFMIIIVFGLTGISIVIAVFLNSIRTLSTGGDIATIFIQLGLGFISSAFLIGLTMELYKAMKILLNKTNQLFIKTIKKKAKKGDENRA